MKLGELDAEALTDRDNNVGKQCCAIGIKQPVKWAHRVMAASKSD